MRNFHLLLLLFCGGKFRVTNSFGLKPTTKCAPLFQQQRRQQPNPNYNNPTADSSSSRCYAFGGGNGGFETSIFNSINNSPPPLKLESKGEVVRHVGRMVRTTVKQFTSGFTTGYLLGSFWGLLRSATSNKGLIWGLDFGVLAALFSASTSVTEFMLALLPATQQNAMDNDDDDDDDTAKKNIMKQKQRAQLWPVVMRNIILAIYLNRHSGVSARMVRMALLYGGGTYFFVGRKIKADVQRKTMFGSGNDVMGGSDAMQQFLQQMMTMQTGQTVTTTPGGIPQQTFSRTQRGGTTSRPSTTNASPASPLFNNEPKNKSIKDSAVDVEFEKVVDTDNDDDDAR